MMSTAKWGLVIFALGVFFIHVHTTLAFLWALLGFELATYPLLLKWISPYFPGFTPAIGAILLVVAGLLYSRSLRRSSSE